MKSRTHALIVLASTAGLVLAGVTAGATAGATAASAAPLPTDVGVFLDDTAPAPHSVVRDVVTLSGHAEAIEGVRRVELYAVAPRPAGRVPTGAPVATAVYEVPRTAGSFTLTWAPTGAARTVDLVVVARTSGRTGQAEIAGITVGTPASAARKPAAAPRPAPAPAPAPAARRPLAEGTGPLPVAPAVPQPAPGPAVRTGDAADVSAGQAGAFYQVYSQTPYQTEVVTTDPAPRARVTLPARGGRQVPWSAFGIGTLLLACAALVLRVSRPVRDPAYA
jgi:hypothetical protein